MKKNNISIDLIKPYTKNAKKHDAKQIKLIAESIKRFGFLQPIVLDKNNEIVAGHGRYEGAKILGLKDVPVIKAENLTEQEIQAYRLADNQINAMTGFDMGLVIEDLKGLDNDLLDLTGFDKDLIIEGNEQDDVIPENAPPVAKLGDIWQLGRHRVMCGDSTKNDDVEKLMDGKKADMVFTDPPYNIGFSYNQHKDKMKYDDYKDFCKRWFDLLDSDKIIISPGPKNMPIWYEIMNVRDIGWAVENTDDDIIFDEAIWQKDNTRSGASCFHLRVCEPIIFYGKFDKKRNLDIFKFSRKIDAKLRKAQEGIKDGNVAPGKPVALIEEIIVKFSNEKDLIKDIFLGNGTTLIACEKTNRICYGMELDPKYVDVIIKRWEDYTNQKAVKL